MSEGNRITKSQKREKIAREKKIAVPSSFPAPNNCMKSPAREKYMLTIDSGYEAAASRGLFYVILLLLHTLIQI